jgi:hypothetical protein
VAGAGNLNRSHGATRIAIEGGSLDLGLGNTAAIARRRRRPLARGLRRLCQCRSR